MRSAAYTQYSAKTTGPAASAVTAGQSQRVGFPALQWSNTSEGCFRAGQRSWWKRQVQPDAWKLTKSLLYGKNMYIIWRTFCWEWKIENFQTQQSLGRLRWLFLWQCPLAWPIFFQNSHALSSAERSTWVLLPRLANFSGLNGRPSNGVFLSGLQALHFSWVNLSFTDPEISTLHIRSGVCLYSNRGWITTFCRWKAFDGGPSVENLQWSTEGLPTTICGDPTTIWAKAHCSPNVQRGNLTIGYGRFTLENYSVRRSIWVVTCVICLHCHRFALSGSLIILQILRRSYFINTALWKEKAHRTHKHFIVHGTHADARHWKVRKLIKHS